MLYADTVGLYNVERAMRKYAQQPNGEAWTPAARITELAASDGRFNA